MTNVTNIKTVTRKIGANKNKRRIWLEGAVLRNANLLHGDRFDVSNGGNVLHISRNPAGERKVAGKAGREIIDMSASTITNSFSDDVVAVTVITTQTGLTLIGII